MTKYFFESKVFGTQYYFADGSNEQIVVFIHGFAEDASIFNNLSESLLAHYTIICINIPGSGNAELSKRNASIIDFANYTLESINNFTCDKKQYQNKKIFICGHSMGGYITLAFANLFPDYCNGITLINSSIFADDALKKETRLKAIELIKKGGKELFFKALIKNLYAKKFYANHPKVIDNHLTMAMLIDAETIEIYYRAMMQRPDSTELVAKLKIPIQFIIGDQDAVVPLETSLQQCHIANLNVVDILKPCGHSSVLECEPQLLQKLTHFFSF
jgi:pimeloyl-ACP methyl ester carboxylesterase